MRRFFLLPLILLAGCATPQPAPVRVTAEKHHVVAHRRAHHAARHVIVGRRMPLPRARPSEATPAKTVEIIPLAPRPIEPPAVAAAKPRVAVKKTPWVPAGARKYCPLLVTEQRSLWPKVPQPWTIAGLIEQESLWRVHAELKTYREYGFGFGQFTIAYRSDRSVRFNKFAELKRQFASLSGWTWSDRFNPRYQLAAVVEMVHAIWRHVPPAADGTAKWAFTLSSYNGGLGSLLQDRRLCANSSGCDPTRWFGNIETHSLKSRRPQPAYGGQSWFSINRGYVQRVMKVRRQKYRQFWE